MKYLPSASFAPAVNYYDFIHSWIKTGGKASSGWVYSPKNSKSLSDRAEDNLDAAVSRLNLEEGALSGAVDLLQRKEAVILDMAKHAGKDFLAAGDHFGEAEIKAAAEAQLAHLEPGRHEPRRDQIRGHRRARDDVGRAASIGLPASRTGLAARRMASGERPGLRGHPRQVDE